MGIWNRGSDETSFRQKSHEARRKEISMKEIKEALKQHMTQLFWSIVKEKEALTMDGVWGYNDKAQFVAGKAINLCSYVVLEYLKDSDEFDAAMAGLKSVIPMLAKMPMDTWGTLNGITGLYRLQTAGYLEQAVDEETMDLLKKALDWRTFVDIEDNYALIGKPTNYYGVAFGIARYRELLGWEPEKHSWILLDRLINHIQTFSGEFGYMDETKGEGRFDRYSILIPSEITALVLETNFHEPDLIRQMLDRSAHIFLKLANEAGTGFSYGRSIGAYGDTAALEVLSAATELGGIFTEEEEKLAYGYTMRVLRSLVDFWYDEEMQSINMWEKGRKTDQYRNKNRILSENLSLHMQAVNSLSHWAKAGYDKLEEPEGWEKLLDAQEAYSFIRFAKDEYDRGLVIVRQGKMVWSLPLINGGTKYFSRDPYMPVPRQNFVSEGVPDVCCGAMVPKLVMENGDVVMPVSYISQIETREEDSGFTVVCRQKELCLMGEMSPRKAEGISSVTTYRFRDGVIIREDEFAIDESWQVREVALEMQTFSREPQADGCRVSFGEGCVTAFEAEGYGECQAYQVLQNVDEIPEHEGYRSCKEQDYDTPHGRLAAGAVWKKTLAAGERCVKVGWKMEYRQQ